MFSESSLLPSIKEVVENLKKNTTSCLNQIRPKTVNATTVIPTIAEVDGQVIVDSGVTMDQNSTSINSEILVDSSNIIDFVPIEWFPYIHGDELDITIQMKKITMSTIPMIRQFGNSAVMDLLLYQTTEFQYRITMEVVRKINLVYENYCRNNPDFNGSASILGHSLGSVIAYDILSVQHVSQGIPIEVKLQFQQAAPFSNSPSSDEVSFARHQLNFLPHSFFAVGSPIGKFLCLNILKI